MLLVYFNSLLMQKYIYLSLFLLLSHISFSQSLIGTQSNYSGSNSLFMNPALMSTSHIYTDFSIANFGIVVYNDYAYIKGNDLRKFLFSEDHAAPTYLIGDRIFNFAIHDKLSYKPKNIYESLDLNLLRFMFYVDNKQSVGFSLNGRVYTNAINVPWEIPEICTFGTEDSDYHNHYSSFDSRIATMEWMEVAMSYSRRLFERYVHRFDAGVTIKYLMGYSAAAGNINNLDYEIFNDTNIMVNTFNADLAYSLPINYNTSFTDNNSIFNESLTRGNGVALDLGFTYTHRSASLVNKKRHIAPCMLEKLEYKWRVGVSLMDLGFINFKKNAVDNYFDFNGEVRFIKSDYDNVESFDQLLKLMSATYYEGDSVASMVGDNFKMGLPTTLRLQFDYNIRDNFYVNTTFIQPLRLLKYSVEASQQILVESRYESVYFDFGLPLTLRDYRHFCIGATARFGFITIGTQNLATYLGFGKVNGMDLFVSLKFNFIKGSCVEDRFDACWSSDFGNKSIRKRRW